MNKLYGFTLDTTINFLIIHFHHWSLCSIF